ncbi:MAG TPA: hypothetical protein VGI86_03905 [Acidimicrobiia bacterium]
MKRGVWRAIAAGAAVAMLGGCAISEYTTTHAESDLVKAGWSRSEAACFVNGLNKYYSDQYVEINRHQAAIRHVPFTGVSPQGTGLYVRNELSNAGNLSAAESAEVQRLVQQCRGSQT